MKHIQNISFTQINIFLSMCLGSTMLGVGVLKFPWPSSCLEQRFIHTSEFVVWLILVGVMFAFMPVCFTSGFFVLKRLRRYLSAKLSINVICFFLLFLSLFSIPQLISGNSPKIFPFENVLTLKIRANIIVWAFGFAVLPSILSLAVMLRIALQLNPENDDFIDHYFDLQKLYNVCMLVLGIIVGIGTIATGGLQRALASLGSSMSFSPEFTVIYGAYGSLVLLILSLPLEMILYAKGLRFIDDHIPAPAVYNSEWRKDYELRKKAKEWLGLKQNILIQIRSSFVSLTPLLGGLFAFLLPLKS